MNGWAGFVRGVPVEKVLVASCWRVLMCAEGC